jgi:hypothetical protein
MSLAGIWRREELVTEETFTHHVLPATDKPCDPYEILAGRETELDLNVMKKLKGVAADGIEAGASHFNEIAHVTLVKS